MFFRLVAALILIWNSATAQKIENYIHYSSSGYSRFGENLKSINFMSIGDSWSKEKIVFEIKSFPFTWVSHDPLNKNKGNFGFPLNPILFISAISNDADELSKFSSKSFVFLLIGGRYHYFLFNVPNKLRLAYGLSAFIKNDFDWFCFRRNQWLNVSPGGGLSLFLVVVRAQIGVNRNYSISVNSTKAENYYFFELNLLGRDD